LGVNASTGVTITGSDLASERVGGQFL